VQPIYDLWQNFVNAVKGFWNWISNKVFKLDIHLPDLPAWAIPGSPLPIHTAWRNFAREMDSLTIRPRFDLDQVAELALPGGLPSQTVYNYNVQAQYAYQDERSLMDDVRLMEMMHT
jgi:hypothetical protein